MLHNDRMIYTALHIYRRYLLPNLAYFVTAGVLMASAYLAISPSTRILSLMVIMVAGLVGGVYLFRYPRHGLLILVAASFLITFSIGTGTGTSINASIFLVIALTFVWLVDMILFKKEIRFVGSRTILPLFLLILFSLIGFINGQLNWFSTVAPAPFFAQLGGTILFILVAATFLVVLHLVDDLVWIERLTWLFLAIGSIFILLRAFPQFTRYANRYFAYGSTAAIFWLWMISLTASQAFFNRDLKPLLRFLLLGLLGVLLFQAVYLAYDWKSGWIPGVLSLMVMIWFGAPKIRLLALPAAAILLVFGFIDIQSTVTGNEEYSLLTRVEAWYIMIEIIKVNPFLGVGPANYYFYTPLFPILGYNVSFNSHNNYIDILAQIGIFGLIVFLILLFEISRSGFRVLKIAPPGFPRAFVLGALGGLAGSVISGILGDWLIPFVYNVGFVGFRSSVFGWIFLACLVAMERILPTNESTNFSTS